MKDKHASMTKKSLTKNRWLGTAQVSNKRRTFLPEQKGVAEDIKQRISSRHKLSYILINNNMSSEILNSYYSMVNYTWLCDKVRIFQSSNNWMSDFIQSYNFINKKHSKKVEATRGNYSNMSALPLIFLASDLH